MKKAELPKYNIKTLLEHVLASQVLLLARQLRADDTARGKVGKADYDRKAVQIIRNAREAILFRWNYELPEKKTVPGTVFASFARGRYLHRGIRKGVGSHC